MDEFALLAGLLQGSIVALVIVAVRRENVAAAINALVSLGLAVLPVAYELFVSEGSSQAVSFGPELTVWVAAAGFLHSLGMLGLYESTWWWDHLTHTVSAALVAAVLYAGVLVALPTGSGFGSDAATVKSMTVVGTLTIGVWWELIELFARELGERFDIEPVLIHYGWDDTIADLGFDIVGALLIVVADVRLFVPATEQSRETTVSLLLASGLVVVVSGVLMALFVGYGIVNRG